MTKNDEALQVEKITLQAKLGILSLNFLCAIIAFAMFNDLQRQFLSPFFIGSLLLLIVIVCKLTIHSETVDDIHIYVHDFSDKSKLNRHSKLKRIVHLILWIVYLVLIANIVTPNINHTSNYEWVGVVVALCMFDDKRIKYTEMDTPTIENRGALPKGVLNLIPNYRYADEQQKLVILKVHATNFIWITIGLTIVCIVDVIIELILHQMPLAAYITIIFIVVELLILKLKNKQICSTLHE